MVKKASGGLVGVAKKKARRDTPNAAQAIIEGDAWRAADPRAPAARDDQGRYVQTFLLRLNPWEIGALAVVAKQQERSAQATARRLLREALMRELEE